MAKPKQPTMRDVAQAAGVSLNAVSLAMNRHPSIPSATRKRILDAARELGYRLNPLISAVMRRQRNLHHSDTGRVAAFLTFGDKEDAWRNRQAILQQFDGAQQRAAEHGFRCEPIWADNPELSGARLSQILRARGIQGILIGPLGLRQKRLDLQWHHFSTVAIGRSLAAPDLDRVSPAWFHACAEAFSQLQASGHRRIGLLLQEHLEARMERAASAVWANSAIGRPDTVPPYRVGSDATGSDGIVAWWNEHRPDAILAVGDYRECFTQNGIHPGRDFTWSFLSIPPGLHGVTGISFDHRILGCIAMDHLLGLLLNNQIGLPAHPREILLEGTWKSGLGAAGAAPAQRSNKRRSHSPKSGPTPSKLPGNQTDRVR